MPNKLFNSLYILNPYLSVTDLLPIQFPVKFRLVAMGMDWNDAFLTSLVGGLEVLRNDQLYTDVTIHVENKTFECHKAVLCSLSPYFNGMFASDMRESRDGAVTLPFLDSKTFETLLDFFYGGKDIATADNAEDILRAANLMQIGCLQKRCEEVLCETLEESNCIEFWKLSRQYSCSQLEKEAWCLLRSDFPAMAKLQSFLTLDIDEVIGILKDEDLTTTSEGVVCDAAMRWIQDDIENRKPLLDRLLQCLKLPLAGVDYLLRLCSENPFLETDPLSKPFIEEARLYHLCPAIQEDMFSSRTAHGKCSSLEDVVVTVGGKHIYRTVTQMICHASD
jgi:hypothetical protein